MRLWVILAVLGGLAVLAGAVYLGDKVMDDRREKSTAERLKQPPKDAKDYAFRYERFCDTKEPSPGVPAFKSGEPAEVWVEVPEVKDTVGEAALPFSFTISPEAGTDVTRDRSNATDTRAVACARRIGQDEPLNSCEFTIGRLSGAIINLERGVYEIKVYELRTGDVIAQGEVLTEPYECPDRAPVEGDLEWALREPEVVAWLQQEFADGQPG